MINVTIKAMIAEIMIAASEPIVFFRPLRTPFKRLIRTISAVIAISPIEMYWNILSHQAFLNFYIRKRIYLYLYIIHYPIVIINLFFVISPFSPNMSLHFVHN